jgi:hypothetical protein
MQWINEINTKLLQVLGIVLKLFYKLVGILGGTNLVSFEGHPFVSYGYNSREGTFGF